MEDLKAFTSEDLKAFTLIVTTGGVIITAILTHFFTLKREKYSKTFEYKLQILKDIYTPIYRILSSQVEPGEPYEGIEFHSFQEIERIIESNLELTDPNLESIIWEMKEGFLFSQSVDEYRNQDQNRSLLDYVLFQYNKLRKELGLPHDSSAVSFNVRLGFYIYKYKMNKKRKEARNSIKSKY
ncbi:hypothetical protein ACS2QR_16925 [Bacillus cereus group sp. Bce026]|uniref:hypothetical protein n=1 Tax=Bacillus cereus group sp. Bce026 TaxID=3445242 RepID=UPI003F29C38D